MATESIGVMKQKKKNIMISDQQENFLLLLGYNYLKGCKLEKAITIFKVLYYLYPKCDIYSLCLSYLHLKLKQYEKTLFYAEIYMTKQNGKLKQGRLIKSKALFEMGLVEEAKKCVQKIFV